MPISTRVLGLNLSSILPLVLLATILHDATAVRVGLVFQGGPDADKEGTSNSAAKQGAYDACSPPKCLLTLTSPSDETESAYMNIVPDLMSKNDYVITQNYFAFKATKETASNSPDKELGIINFEFTPPIKNVASILFREDQQGFMAGLLAGEIAKDRGKKVAVIGGTDIPPIRRKVNGFANGVKAACEECTAFCMYSQSFTNEKGESEQIAKSLGGIKGLDVVYNAGSITGTTALKSLTVNNGVYGIGDTTDEWVTNWALGSVPGSERIITSIIQDYRVVVADTISSMVNGTFQTGGVIQHGLKASGSDSALKFADCHEACEINTPGLKEKMQGYVNKIAKQEMDIGVDHKSGRSKISSGGSSCSMVSTGTEAGDTIEASKKKGKKSSSSSLRSFCGATLLIMEGVVGWLLYGLV